MKKTEKINISPTTKQLNGVKPVNYAQPIFVNDWVLNKWKMTEQKQNIRHEIFDSMLWMDVFIFNSILFVCNWIINIKRICHREAMSTVIWRHQSVIRYMSTKFDYHQNSPNLNNKYDQHIIRLVSSFMLWSNQCIICVLQLIVHRRVNNVWGSGHLNSCACY